MLLALVGQHFGLAGNSCSVCVAQPRAGICSRWCQHSPTWRRMSSRALAAPADDGRGTPASEQTQQASRDQEASQGENSGDQLLSACSRLDGPTPACEQMLRSTAALLAEQGPPYSLDWATRIAPHLTVNNLATKQPLARIAQSPYFTVTRRPDDTAHATVALRPDAVIAKHAGQDSNTICTAQLTVELAALSVAGPAAAQASSTAAANEEVAAVDPPHIDPELLAAACAQLPGSTPAAQNMVRVAASFLAAQGSPYQSDWATQVTPHLTLAGVNVKQPLNKLQASPFFRIIRREHDLTHATIQLLPGAVLKHTGGVALETTTATQAPSAASSRSSDTIRPATTTPAASSSISQVVAEARPYSAADLAAACNTLDGATPDISRMLRSTAALLAEQGSPYSLDWATRIAPHLTVNNLAVKQPLARIAQSPYFTVTRRPDDTAHATVALRLGSVLAKCAVHQSAAALPGAPHIGSSAPPPGGGVSVPRVVDRDRLLAACHQLSGSSNTVTQLVRAAASYLAAMDHPYEADWATQVARHLTLKGISVKQPLTKLQASSYFKITRREHDVTHATLQLIPDRVFGEHITPADAIQQAAGGETGDV